MTSIRTVPPTMDPTLQPTPSTIRQQTQTLTAAAQPQKTQASVVPGQSTFSQGSNLINAQFTPQNSNRLNTAEGMTNTAASNFAGMQMPGTQTVSGPDYSKVYTAMGPQGAVVGAPAASYGAETNKLREMTLADLEKVRGGEDRSKLAADAYDLMLERSAPEHEKRQQALIQQQTALGRIGSGMMERRLGDANTERERELSLSRRELANSAAGSTLQDRLAALQATQGVGDQFTSQDAKLGAINAGARSGMDMSRMEQARFLKDIADSDYGARFAERGYGDSRSDVGFDRSRSQFTTLADFEQGQRGNERQDRDESRVERGYQYGSERDARGDFERDRDFSYGQSRDAQGDRERNFDRLYQYGYSGNPTGVQQYVSGQYQDSGQAGTQGMGDALGEYLYQQNMRNRQSGGAQYPQAQTPYNDAAV